MTPLRHYLEFQFAGQAFLLPNTPDLLIEPRENMQVERRGQAAAVRSVQGVVWRAYALGADLRPLPDSAWTRAVFLNINASQPIGLLVDELKLLPVDNLRIEPFTPLGPAPATGYHLFHAAAMRAQTLTLVIAPAGLLAYLQAQEGDHGLGE
ncbi:MAG: hypothetical protein ACYDEV_12500 [Acidiferrobacter sp.]